MRCYLQLHRARKAFNIKQNNILVIQAKTQLKLRIFGFNHFREVQKKKYIEVVFNEC